MLERVGDVNVAKTIDRYTLGVRQERTGREASFTRETLYAASRDGRDVAGRIDSPDAIATALGDNDVTVPVDGDVRRLVEKCLDRSITATDQQACSPLGRAAGVATVGRVAVAVIATFAVIESRITTQLALAAVGAASVASGLVAIVTAFAGVFNAIPAPGDDAHAAIAASKAHRNHAAVSIPEPLTSVELRLARAELVGDTCGSGRTQELATRHEAWIDRAAGQEE